MNWKLDGACATLTPAEADRLFFSAGRVPNQATDMCGRCPVKERCRGEAERNREAFGVWGGESGPVRAARLGLEVIDDAEVA